MKCKIFLLFVIFFCCKTKAQNFFEGIISSENIKLSGVEIFNKNLRVKAVSDRDGNFKILANVSDEIRVIKNGYEFKDIRLYLTDFQKIININLEPKPIEIEEIKISFKPTGNLEKDMKFFKKSEKTFALNQNLRKYIKENPAKPESQTKIPFKRDLNEGQISLFSVGIGGGGSSGGLIGGIISLVKGNKK